MIGIGVITDFTELQTVKDKLSKRMSKRINIKSGLCMRGGGGHFFHVIILPLSKNLSMPEVTTKGKLNIMKYMKKVNIHQEQEIIEGDIA